MTDILSMVEPESFGRAQMLRDAIGRVAAKLQITNAWEIHLAVMLAPLGYVTIPPETLVRSRAGFPLSEPEQQVLAQAPEVAARLLANIPRLEGVAHIVRYQSKCFDGTGFPADKLFGDAIPLGARLLKILLDLLELQGKGLPRQQAVVELQSRGGWYDPFLLNVVCSTEGITEGGAAEPASSVQAVMLRDLAVGMVLRSNVETKDGTLILSAGHQISEMILERIRNFGRLSGIREPLTVECAKKAGG